ncbi:MAG: ribosome small subunit-dependent GTPase A [Oscillospiraceae bacterium]|nr:ribosome small subunit-dependent GTPase A [Oscillospiraceae bacterium]
MYTEQTIPARVIAVHRERYAVLSDRGEGYARLKKTEYTLGKTEIPVVGDYVLLEYVPDGDSRITCTLPRKSWFSRRDPDRGRGEQILAANFDYVFLLQSLNRDFNLKRLERYLTLAWQSGAQPVVLLTKADLAEDPTPQLRAVQQVAAGVAVHALSAATGAGLEALEVYLQPGKTVVFLGSSGVGKSSLVNALAGREIMTVGGIRETDSRGRHTTTHRQLLTLDSGAMVIDTPGMRELGIWEAADGLEAAFADVEALAGRCRFRDCRHGEEPGCAVRAALERGELDPGRWARYRQLREEAQRNQSRDSYRQRREKIFKEIARSRRKKEDK